MRSTYRRLRALIARPRDRRYVRACAATGRDESTLRCRACSASGGWIGCLAVDAGPPEVLVTEPGFFPSI
jgi:hypothetical protein